MPPAFYSIINQKNEKIFMANDMLNLSINKEMLTPVIEQQVKLLMCEILGGKDEIVSKLISQVLNQKVDENGKPNNYSSNKTFFEYLFVDELKKLLIELVREEVRGKQSKIKTLMRNYLKSDKGASALSEALLNGWLGTMNGYDWTTRVEINVERSTRY